MNFSNAPGLSRVVNGISATPAFCALRAVYRRAGKSAMGGVLPAGDHRERQDWVVKRQFCETLGFSPTATRCPAACRPQNVAFATASPRPKSERPRQPTKTPRTGRGLPAVALVAFS